MTENSKAFARSATAEPIRPGKFNRTLTFPSSFSFDSKGVSQKYYFQLLAYEVEEESIESLFHVLYFSRYVNLMKGNLPNPTIPNVSPRMRAHP